MKIRDRHAVLITALLLMLVSMACLPTPSIPSPMPATAEQVTEMTSTPTTAASATDEGCTLGSSFVADVAVPDDTEFLPGESFIKTWRLRNTGTCPWEPGTVLVFSSGDQMGGPASVAVGPVVPGATTDVSLNQVAPMAPGTYRGNWQLQTPTGVRFGAIPYVQIVVVGAAAPPAPTAGPTTAPSTCGVPPDAALEPILTYAEGLGYDIGCPTSAAFSIDGAFQEYWENADDSNSSNDLRSFMVWRSDIKEIYVIVGEDAAGSEGMIMAYTDSWDESQYSEHPDCVGMSPPSGHQLPIRGFGKTWCENHLWDYVGWPQATESTVTLLVQPMQSGLLLQITGPVGYLMVLDYRAVHALTSPLGP